MPLNVAKSNFILWLSFIRSQGFAQGGLFTNTPPPSLTPCHQARPHTCDLTSTQADPCFDVLELHQRDHDILAAAKEAAELVRASQGQPGEVVRAAEHRLAEVQQQVRTQVLEPRKRRRQLYSQVTSGSGPSSTIVPEKTVHAGWCQERCSVSAVILFSMISNLWMTKPPANSMLACRHPITALYPSACASQGSGRVVASRLLLRSC